MNSIHESQVYTEDDSLLSQEISVYSTTESESQKSSYTKRQWTIFAVLSLAMFFSAMVYSLQGPFFPREAELQGISPEAYGFVFGVFELVVFIICPLFGTYVGLMRPKSMINAGTFVMAACCIGFGFLNRSPPGTPFISLAFAVRIIEALGQAAFDTASYAIVVCEFPDSIATTFSVIETLGGLGVVVGPIVGGFLYEVAGYTLPFLSVGGSLMLTAILMACLLPKNEETAEQKPSFIRLLRIPTVLICYFAVASAAFSIGFLQPVLEPHLRQFNLSVHIVNLMFVINGGVYALTAIIWGLLADRYVNPKLLCTIGSLFTISSFILIGPADFIPLKSTLWLVIVSLVLNGIGVGAEFVAAFLECNQAVLKLGFPNNTETYGMVSGLWASGLALGGFLGPSIAGVLVVVIGFKTACLVNVGLHALVGIFTFTYLICGSGTSRKDDYDSLPN